METTSHVLRFIARRIEATGQLQKDIAERAGFEKPNIITMIKQGKTRLPLDKIGPMAKALEMDPVELFAMCMEEYQPATWKAIAPFMETAFTPEEQRLVANLRVFAGGPFISVLGEESQALFEDFMRSLRTDTRVQ